MTRVLKAERLRALEMKLIDANSRLEALTWTLKNAIEEVRIIRGRTANHQR